MPNLIGQSLGRYHILEQLGEGGMAIVYKAFDTRLERDVAVKVIRVDQFAPAALERILKRFEREARALARLTHPNIVHVNDYGEQDGIPYLVMDYLPGGTLQQLVGKPMPWPEAVKLLLPIAEALDYAHTQSIIHRDVKPSNILLTQRRQPMLTDFGIAKLLESEETHTLTGTGVGVGTPEYMAPEQWTGLEGCQNQKARFVQNHIGCAILVWICLKQIACISQSTIHQVKNGLLSDYLRQQLKSPVIQMTLALVLNSF
jgi:serine/threonine protein kinase